MSRVYDLWEKLVGAVFNREELRRLALRDSFSSSTFSDYSSGFTSDSSIAYPVARPIELKEIIKATENFQLDMLIGEGVMCQAFIACIDEHALTALKPGSGMAVTVKKWSSMERPQDWLKKIDNLVQLCHPCLVSFVGYYTEEHNMMLVYEFMPHGRLSDHLFTTRYRSLPWARRIKIAIDIARELSYLHEQDIPIIHRDFKTANVLLDWELNAKLSNYCYGIDDPTGEMTSIPTRQIFVSPGYTPPEYISKAYKVVKLALKCLNQDPKSRPRMSDVVVALEQFQGYAPM
ncbi:probable serine/threonine-protein kinase PBL10 isoform X2 [Salvia hispanica]|uniref:probable serine/threonine-protein kinase PBL10 isoform X2 n=1 Tax=Salvia hispanica TaxID=49212 RepID=UPI0020096580|nr:probable serine/threonine-protein kinase PBL10 isoform X2 [Salvia hispanica]